MKNFKSFIQSGEAEREMQEAREYLAVHPKTDKIDHVSDSKEKRDEYIKSKGNMHKAAQAMSGQKKVGDKYMREDSEKLDEISTKTLAKAASAASDPDSDYSYGKSHDAQKFADYAKKTKDAKSAAAVQGAADAKGHYPRPGHTYGYDKIAGRQMRSATPSMVTKKGVLTKTAVQGLKSSLRAAVEGKEIAFSGSHQGKTTLKHIKNPDVTQRMAAHDIKPGIKGYRDRIALLKDAGQRKNLKKEDFDLLSDLYDHLDESNQEIFLNQLEEDAEVLLAFAKAMADE
jgi:hypothetical protein